MARLQHTRQAIQQRVRAVSEAHRSKSQDDSLALGEEAMWNDDMDVQMLHQISEQAAAIQAQLDAEETHAPEGSLRNVRRVSVPGSCPLPVPRCDSTASQSTCRTRDKGLSGPIPGTCSPCQEFAVVQL